MSCAKFLVFYLFIVSVVCDGKDGGKANRIILNDGNAMPALGLGTFLGFDQNGQKPVLDKEIENPVTWALDAGYRMIDTAALYLNEEQVGRGIKASSVPREHIFVVTKLGGNEKRDVVGALRKSLSRLNLTYVDLYLIHNPVSFTPDESAFDIIDYLDTWKGMEQARSLGLAKSIGISNFNITQMTRLLDHCEIKPAVLQVEVNLNLGQDNIISFCKERNIAIMAYTPFGSLFTNEGAPPPRANDEVLTKMAAKYGKSVPQIVLRFLVQKAVAPIPKSVRKERIEENINIFDFKLNEKDMKELGKFNNGYRTVHPSFWQDHPYYPFELKETAGPNLFAPKPKDD